MRRTLPMSLTVALALAFAWPVAAQEAVPPKEDARYARVQEADDGTLVLELAARAFVPAREDGQQKAGPRVLLVSAIHIGEPAYYESLQRLLDAQSLVLFEGVRPPGAGRIPADADDESRAELTRGRLAFLKSVVTRHADEHAALPTSFDQLVSESGTRWRSILDGSRDDAWSRPFRLTFVEADDEAKRAARVTITSDGADGVAGSSDDLSVECAADEPGDARAGRDSASGIQTKLATSLGLVFQLDRMDSSKPNWRSSDMSIDELEAKLKDTGADGSMIFGMLDGTSLVGALAELLLDFIGRSAQMQAMAKIMLIETLGSTDLSSGSLPKGPKSMEKLMRVLVEERNAVVLRDLRAALDSQPELASIAIFYGAGHMGDLERRLRDEFDLEAAETTWLPAMRANPRDAGLSKRQAKSMRDTMRRMLDGAR